MFRENPELFDEIEEISDEIANDDESDDSLFGKDDDPESESESEDDRTGLTGRSRWLKKAPKKEKTNEELFAKNPKHKVQKAQKVDSLEIKEDQEDKILSALFLDITQDTLYQKLGEVLDARGKKNTDKHLQIKILKHLLSVSHNPYQIIRVLLTLIPSQFDVISTSSYLTVVAWQS